MGKGKVKPFQALKGQPNFTSCSKYSKIVCSMNLPREGDVVNSYLVVIVGYALFLILLGYGIGKHVKGHRTFCRRPELFLEAALYDTHCGQHRRWFDGGRDGAYLPAWCIELVVDWLQRVGVPHPCLCGRPCRVARGEKI